eukprot:15510578-Heterocapsa_arctica.AAC.1
MARYHNTFPSGEHVLGGPQMPLQSCFRHWVVCKLMVPGASNCRAALQVTMSKVYKVPRWPTQY